MLAVDDPAPALATAAAVFDAVDEDEERKKHQTISLGQIKPDEVIGGEDNKKFKSFIEFSSDEKDPENSQTKSFSVTKNEFEEILRKNHLDKVNSRYGRFSVCKIKLKDDEEIKIGDSEIREQHFIDIKDAKNDIRFFIDAEAYENLKEYKDTLYDKFKAYLDSQTSSEIGDITQQINDFKSLDDITSIVSAGSANTVANKLGLDSEEKIAKKAQDLTELYINKRFAMGKMSTEKDPSASGNFTEEKFGFFKVVKNKKRPQDIRVYKSEEPTKLKILNVTVGNNEIMQFETCNAGEIKSGRHFMRTNEYAAFQRVDDPKVFSKESRGTSIRIFKERTDPNDSNKKTMDRFKIKVGVDSEESFLKSKKEIVFVENVIELGDSDSASINIGHGVKIIRDNDRSGKLIIKYGEINSCLPFMSNHHGGYIYNDKPENVVGRKFNLKAHSSIVEKITPEPPCFKSKEPKHHSVILKILDKKNDSFSYVELEKKGSRTSPFKSTYKAKILEKRFEEKFDPRSAVYSSGR